MTGEEGNGQVARPLKGSLTMKHFLWMEHQIPLLVTIIFTHSRLNIRGVVSGHGTQVCGPKISVRNELDGLLRGWMSRGLFGIPEHTLTKPMLEPHQRWDDGYDLGH